MRHSFIDKYSDLNSFIHKLDPRCKIVCFLLYILFVVLNAPTNISRFFLYFMVILSVVFLSRLPIVYVLKRSLVVIPFVILVAIFIPFLKENQVSGGYNLSGTYNKLTIFWNILIKSYLAVLSMIVLSSTTKFSMLLKGLEMLKVPKILIMILSFMYRYIFVLIDEAERLERARNIRYFGGHYFRQIKIFANIIGLLFIRAYERGERVYQSMVARGFDGEIRTLSNLKFKKVDILFSVIFISILVILKFG